MSAKYSGRIHDPNHVLQDYNIYFNDDLVSSGYNAADEVIKLIQRNIESFTVPDGVTQLGTSVFRACENLTRVILPDGLRTIQSYAVSSCTNLTEIYIPSSVMYISAKAFDGDTRLTKIYCGFAEGAIAGPPWGAPPWGADANAEVLYNQDRPEGL